MNGRVSRGVVCGALLIGVLTGVGGCGGDDEVVIPSAEELGAALVTVDTYDGEWTVDVPPDWPGGESGVVPAELQDQLPSMELCDAASDASRAALDSLRWMAFRQIDLTVDDPLDPPGDVTGHMVAVQEFLTSGDPAEMEELFGLLRDGAQACLGDIPAGDEGPGRTEEMVLPDVGDERFGQLTVMEESGGGAEWLLHLALVRTGGVLAMIDIMDIRAGVEPYYTVEEIGAMVETAIDRL
jgi:hypothetical protein